MKSVHAKTSKHSKGKSLSWPKNLNRYRARKSKLLLFKTHQLELKWYKTIFWWWQRCSNSAKSWRRRTIRWSRIWLEFLRQALAVKLTISKSTWKVPSGWASACQARWSASVKFSKRSCKTTKSDSMSLKTSTTLRTKMLKNSAEKDWVRS